jgi:hypothetical protein
VRFTEQRVHLTKMPIAFGKMVRGQMAMDFSAQNSPETHDERVVPMDALLASIAEINAAHVDQPPPKISEVAELTSATQTSCGCRSWRAAADARSATTPSGCATVECKFARSHSKLALRQLTREASEDAIAAARAKPSGKACTSSSSRTTICSAACSMSLT